MKRIKIMTVVGARPQFVKGAMVSRAFNDLSGSVQVVEEIIHTGQHYDPAMSDIFFSQMSIPKPAALLDLGGGSHGRMTGRMLEALEQEMLRRKPQIVLVYGDTNSTLAAALAAAKLHIPVAHVEAGLRSFNHRMPEEINRVLTDHCSQWCMAPTSVAVANLKNEGITNGVHQVGDVMYDAALTFRELAESNSSILERLSLRHKDFYLVTVHRQENTDDPARLDGIIRAFKHFASIGRKLIWPLHPRLKNQLGQQQWPDGIILTDPLPFLDMVRLEMSASLILTDSGGVQKEAYFHNTPCVTLRDETEWVETVEAGWNSLAGTDTDWIIALADKAAPGSPITDYGDGNTATRIADILIGS